MYKRGKCWYSEFWWEGERHRKSWGEITKGRAREKDQKWKTEVREGKRTSKGIRITFEKFSEKFLEAAKTNLKHKTYQRYSVSIHMMMDHFKGTLIQNIHPFMVEQYRKKRKDEEATTITINRDVACLRNMLNKAVEWKYLSVNPLKGMKLPKEDNERTWALSPEEEEALLPACEKRRQVGTKYLKHLVEFALNSGMREGEIFNLKKCDVDLENHYVLVTATKTHQNRKVPANNLLTEILKRRISLDGSDYVFCNSAGRKLTALTPAWDSAREDAKLIRWDGGKEIRFRFHDLRHTFGTRLGMMGYGLKTIMEIMGHTNPKTAMRYQHPSVDHKLEAVKSLEKYPQKSPHLREAVRIIPLKTVG